MIKVAVVGYGNIGRNLLACAEQAPDIEIVGVVRRNAQPIREGYLVVEDIKDLGKVDVALLSLPSRLVESAAKQCLELGISTVDSFDIHDQIFTTRATLDPLAKSSQAVCILSAGWDPGSDSVMRALLLACAPTGITYTNFGPGMSMGHSVAARAIEGVEDAISMTIPKGESIHRRIVYVKLHKGADFQEVKAKILQDTYFAKDESYVLQTDDIDSLRNAAHGVELVRNGVSGHAQNQQFNFSMRIDNPALTAQIMVSCARAATRQRPGCYTMIELPVVDLLPGDREDWIHKLV